MTEIRTESGQKLYLATVIDLYSRRLLGAAMGLHPDADLACAAIKMAVVTALIESPRVCSPKVPT
jgi:putative transposase